MSTLQGSAISCGVQQLSGLDGHPKTIIRQAFTTRRRDFYEPSPHAHVVFSDVEGAGGSKLAAYIRANKLGELVETPARTNPNSGNEIIVWAWTPDKQAIHDLLTNKVVKTVKAAVKRAVRAK